MSFGSRQEVVEVHYGKTENARRRIPMSQRVTAVLEMRRDLSDGRWVFPAFTKSGHIEPSTLKKQHAKACNGKAEDDQKTGEKRYDVQPYEAVRSSPTANDQKGNGTGNWAQFEHNPVGGAANPYRKKGASRLMFLDLEWCARHDSNMRPSGS
jgi:hypothetical protein